MIRALSSDGIPGLGDEFVAIPISADQAAAALRICAVVRLRSDPVAGQLVFLRDLIDAQVYLGCIRDAGGCVHRWVELWVQNVDQLASSPLHFQQPLSNAILDERWQQHFEAMRAIDPALVAETGWERTHPLPTFLDVSERRPVHPGGATPGEHWQLCRDDARLVQSGLPPYSTSIHRYLHVPGSASEPQFVPVTTEAPTNDRTQPLADLDGIRDTLPLNPAGGLLLVSNFSPVGLESFVDVLGGGAWPSLVHGDTRLDLTPASRVLNDNDPTRASAGGRLFLGAHGRWGRIVETFHLKLLILASAVDAVERLVRKTQRPLLNLRPESFQVHIEPPGKLPFLWNGCAILVDPGDAVRLPIESTQEVSYLIGRSRGASIYRPESAQRPVHGAGTVRIRRLLEETPGLSVVEGTLSTQERLAPCASDLLWLRLNLAGQRADLYARFEPDASFASGEWRFRSTPQALSRSLVEALKKAAGVLLHASEFETLPVLSTPCDLYSLAVIAVRTLLVNSRTTLPVALDDILSLARQVANTHDEKKPLAGRVRSVFERDSKWRELLGPHFLVDEELSSEDAFDLVAPELWWDALSMLVRMLPGIGPDSTCTSLGDAQNGSLHRVFETVLSDLSSLLTGTRSLIVIDWRFNREVSSVIRSHLSSMKKSSE